MDGLDLSSLKPLSDVGTPAPADNNGSVAPNLDLSSLRSFDDSSASSSAAPSDDQGLPSIAHGLAQIPAGFNEALRGMAALPGDITGYGLAKLTGNDAYRGAGTRTANSAMDALHINPDEFPAHNTTEQLLRGTGAGVGAMVAPETAVGLAGKTGAISDGAMDMLGKIFGSSSSGTQVAKNAIVGGASGLGSTAAQEVVPDQYKPLAGMAGALVGGGLGVGAAEAPSLLASGARMGWDYAAPIIAPYSDTAAQSLAGKSLANSATSPAATVDALSTPTEIVPGSKPTTFQASGDMGLGNLERAFATKNPEPFRTLAGDQNSARLDALTNLQSEGHPEAVSGFFRDQLDQLDQQTQAAHDAAAASARSATENIGGGQPSDLSGGQAQNALQSSLDATKANESALWKAVDPDGNMQTIASPVKQAYQAVYGNLTPEASIGLAPVEKQLGDIVSGYGQTLPLKNLVDLRSAVSTAMRDMKSPLQPNAQAYGRLSQLRGGVEDAISDSVAQKAAQEQTAVSTGAMQPEDALAARMRQAVESWRNDRALEATGTGNSGIATGGTSTLSSQAGAKGKTGGRLGYGSSGADMSGGPLVDQATADRLSAATQATAARKQTFGTAPVSKILQRPGATMPYTMQPGSVASSVWKAGNGGADALGAVLKASPEALEPIKQIAASSLRAKAPNGVIDSKLLENWKTQYGPALGALEKAAPGSTAVFENAAKAGDHLAEVAANRKAAMDAYQKDAVGKILKLDDPTDITKTVGGIFNRADSVKAMRTLAQEASKNPDATAGLRKAVVDHMESKLISNTEAATSSKNLIKSDAFQSFLGKNDAALRQVFSDDELNSMRAVAQDLKRANRSIVSTKLPGTPGTAQDITAVRQNDLKQSLLSKLFTYAATGAAGFAGSGFYGALAGTVGSHVLLGMRETGIKTVEDLIQKAMLDPDLARTLLMKAPRKVGTGSEVTLANKLRQMTVMAPVIAQYPKGTNPNGR